MSKAELDYVTAPQYLHHPNELPFQAGDGGKKLDNELTANLAPQVCTTAWGESFIAGTDVVYLAT